MAKCDACGSWVTPRYKRVFGTNGKLPSCQHCTRRSVKDRGKYRPPRNKNPALYLPVPGAPEDGTQRKA